MRAQTSSPCAPLMTPRRVCVATQSAQGSSGSRAIPTAVAPPVVRCWWVRWLVLSALTMLAWGSLHVVALQGAEYPAAGARVSRRLFNLRYVLWLLGHCLLWLSCFLLLELAAPPMPDALRHHGASLTDAISAHLLGFFLAGNLATGAVNLAVDSMAVPDAVARLVLLGYLALLCAGVTVVERRRVHAGAVLVGDRYGDGGGQSARQRSR
jgi:hypothetical protein